MADGHLYVYLVEDGMMVNTKQGNEYELVVAVFLSQWVILHTIQLQQVNWYLVNDASME